MDVDEEIKPIKGFPGYFADSKGNIFSELRRGKCKKKQEHLVKLKPIKLNKYGHMAVKLKNSVGKYIYRPVHYFVTLAFFGDRPFGKIVCHWPNGKNDNSIKNLFFGTYKQNARDRIRDNTTNSKLTKEDVILIRDLLKQKIKQRVIAEMFDISPTAVNQINTRRTFNFIY